MLSFDDLFKNDFSEKFIVEETNPDKISPKDKDYIDKRQEELYNYLSSSLSIQTHGKNQLDRNYVPTIESLKKEKGIIFLLKTKNGKKLVGYIFVNFPNKKIYNYRHLYVDPSIGDNQVIRFTATVSEILMPRGYKMSKETTRKLGYGW